MKEIIKVLNSKLEFKKNFKKYKKVLETQVDEIVVIPVFKGMLYPLNAMSLNSFIETINKTTLDSELILKMLKQDKSVGLISIDNEPILTKQNTTSYDEYKIKAKVGYIGTGITITDFNSDRGQNSDKPSTKSKLPKTALIKAHSKFLIKEFYFKNKVLYAKVHHFIIPEMTKSIYEQAAIKNLKKKAQQVLDIYSNMSNTAETLLEHTNNLQLLIYIIAPHLTLSYEESYTILTTYSPFDAAKKLMKFLDREISILEISRKLSEKVADSIKESQQKVFLNEQLKAISEELQHDSDPEITELKNKITAKCLPDQAKKAALNELKKLEKSHQSSPEYLVSLNYIELILDLPWEKHQASKLNKKQIAATLQQASAILDKNHFGINKVKQRLLQYLAVLHHTNTTLGEVLLLAGPPGVGKTSLAKSLAESLDRPFVRISLGGMRDEAEIRGHRRTYIAAMPGKILNALKQVNSSAPLILLDEIDKLGSNSGISDIQNALLEILDHQQNSEFTDHYLAIPFDLSQVIFVCTANRTDVIAAPLYDRLEILQLTSYTELEKIQIAKKHLIPQIRKKFKLTLKDFNPSITLVKAIINSYTREAGVRNLKRMLDSYARHYIAYTSGKNKSKYDKNNLQKILGRAVYIEKNPESILAPGVAVGLAYTSVGGDILYIETNAIYQKNKSTSMTLTGNLGKVMQESAKTALSYLTRLVQEQIVGLDIDIEKLLSSHIHIHFPEGAIPKDGPSAGVALFCALASLFTHKRLPKNLCMTGEISLRGKVLAVGGIKEKVLAALRYNKKIVLLPAINQYDVEELPKEVQKALTFIYVENIFDVLQYIKLTNTLANKQKILKLKNYNKKKTKNNLVKKNNLKQ